MLVFVFGQLVHVVLQSHQELAGVPQDDEEKTSTPTMPVAQRQGFRRFLMTAFTNREFITVGQLVAGDSRMVLHVNGHLSTSLFLVLAFRLSQLQWHCNQTGTHPKCPNTTAKLPVITHL